MSWSANLCACGHSLAFIYQYVHVDILRPRELVCTNMKSSYSTGVYYFHPFILPGPRDSIVLTWCRDGVCHIAWFLDSSHESRAAYRMAEMRMRGNRTVMSCGETGLVRPAQPLENGPLHGPNTPSRHPNPIAFLLARLYLVLVADLPRNRQKWPLSESSAQNEPSLKLF
jgi:hypothetical protein